MIPPSDRSRDPMRHSVHAIRLVELGGDAQRHRSRREEEAPRHEMKILRRLRGELEGRFQLGVAYVRGRGRTKTPSTRPETLWRPRRRREGTPRRGPSSSYISWSLSTSMGADEGMGATLTHVKSSG